MKFLLLYNVPHKYLSLVYLLRTN
ncbi:unnamed protein product [Spodoptera littoralis]|uniref:Uncharacterized protein n=1 Tax=Spodoptera littoralis TaxID=7109 RepID=A0A9P0NB11_SPOLI|nr:unnamed protein product [Spodoptera littoralis]CAH1646317.1 unnamed protein product [Spodoptera littoralis]